MYVLLPLIGNYMPLKVIDFILGMDFILFSFNFIPIQDIPVFHEIFILIDYAQESEYLKKAGFESGS